MYVVLHELGHCASFSQNHTDEFRNCFTLIAKEAVKIGLYKKIDFAKESEEFCGIEITDSVI